MAGVVYGGKFEHSINELYSPQNIAETARKFAAHEKQHGPYKFGQSFTKEIIPKADDWADASGSTDGYSKWEKNAGDIPEPIRDRITEIFSINLKSAHPLPMVLKVCENVDGTHDLAVRTFVHKGQIYIGVQMFCPNTALK